MYFCAISGEPPQEPVVSPKSGQLYEKRLILKYIAENGTDPTTGDKLEESDLITIKAHPKASAPRPPTATSVPALLHTLQNEWDALMLETFVRNQQHQATRQELSNALYQQDAATRVIARLIRERDAAREALASVEATTGLSAPQADVDMTDGAQAEGALPSDILSVIEETNTSLSSQRKKRKPPTDYAKPVAVKEYTSIHSIPSLHSSSTAGVTSLDVSSANPTHFLTGGNDKIVQLYDRGEGKVLATLKGHTKRINTVKLREKEGERTLVMSGAADKTVRIWAQEAPSGQYAPQATFKTHKGDITGLDYHPSGRYLAVGSADGSWSLQSLETFQTLYHAPRSTDAYTSLALHPDGCLLALGTPTSAVQIYDIRVQAFVASLSPEEPSAKPFAVNTLSFSENGYHLAAPDGTSNVAIWDLRKQKAAASIPLESEGAPFRINKIRYDPSALWFGVAGSTGLRLISHKTWDVLAEFEQGSEVADLAFGSLGKEVWAVVGREVRVWGNA